MSGEKARLHVFVSYVKEDRNRVKQLVQRLTSDGFEPWWDREKLFSGDDWQRKTKIAIAAADVVVCCLTPTALENSGYFRKEMQYARKRADELPQGSRYLLPVQLKPCKRIPALLHEVHCESLFEVGGYSKFRDVLQARAGELGRAVALASAQVADGIFTATGNNCDGEQYIHQVQIAKTGEQYEIRWDLGDEEVVVGTGVIQGKSLVVTSSQWNFTYDFHADGSLSAEWEQGAFERLTKR